MSEFRGVKKHSDVLMNHNLRKRSINNELFIHSVEIHKDLCKLIIYHSYGYELLEKVKLQELKNDLKIRGLKVRGTKKELVARVFTASENGVEIVKKP